MKKGDEGCESMEWVVGVGGWEWGGEALGRGRMRALLVGCGQEI